MQALNACLRGWIALKGFQHQSTPDQMWRPSTCECMHTLLWRCCEEILWSDPCRVSRSYSNIVDGNYKFQVTAVAASGDVGAAQEADFTVDTTGPTVANVTFSALCVPALICDTDFIHVYANL